MTDAAAQVMLTRQYDPFGNPLLGQTTSGYAFTGREWDSDTNLQYHRARYYSPAAGRFVSVDPAGFIDGPNLYRYSRNGPVRWLDPYGQDAISATLGGARGGAQVGATIGGLVGPGGSVTGAIIGGIVGGAIVGGLAVWLGSKFVKPPKDAYDPNGAKAPGKPTEAEGFKDPKSGEEWAKTETGQRGWKDASGKVWCPSGPRAHGGPHWDVQWPDGTGHQNIRPRR